MDVYSALVTAQCITPNDDGGVQAIAEEHAMPDQPNWMACLFDGRRPHVRRALPIIALAGWGLSCSHPADGFPVWQSRIGPGVLSCRAQSCCYPYRTTPRSISPCVHGEETTLNGATGILFYVRIKEK